MWGGGPRSTLFCTMDKSLYTDIVENVEFAYPVRPWSDAKVDSTFLDPVYYNEYGSWHRGWDINGLRGGDTDLGWPVQSMFPGKVIEVDYAAGWGHVVLVQSETWVTNFAKKLFDPSVESLEVQYAHLHQVTVKEGDVLNAGDHLGSIGKGDNNRYTAHLHLEIRKKSVPAIVRQGGAPKSKPLEECLDPERVFRLMNFSDFGNTARAARSFAPVWHRDYSGWTETRDQLVVTNYFDGKFFTRDEVSYREPRNLWEALVAALKYARKQ